MGIVKISDELHQEIRKASTVMVRSINSQAEFWIKIGRLAELNPTLNFSEIINSELVAGGCLKAIDKEKAKQEDKQND
ncbi:MAG: ParD-like family protein [Psychrosphaera sp.]|nr:ParD-like family protein [Psychrosphaera sp.]